MRFNIEATLEDVSLMLGSGVVNDYTLTTEGIMDMARRAGNAIKALFKRFYDWMVSKYERFKKWFSGNKKVEKAQEVLKETKKIIKEPEVNTVIKDLVTIEMTQSQVDLFGRAIKNGFFFDSSLWVAMFRKETHNYQDVLNNWYRQTGSGFSQIRNKIGDWVDSEQDFDEYFAKQIDDYFDIWSDAEKLNLSFFESRLTIKRDGNGITIVVDKSDGSDATNDAKKVVTIDMLELADDIKIVVGLDGDDKYNDGNTFDTGIKVMSKVMEALKSVPDAEPARLQRYLQGYQKLLKLEEMTFVIATKLESAMAGIRADAQLAFSTLGFQTTKIAKKTPNLDNYGK